MHPRPSSAALEAAGDHPEGLDRKFYEICALSELKNALRPATSVRARGFRDFDDYLLPAEVRRTRASRPAGDHPNSDQYEERLQCWTSVGHRHPPRTTSCRCHPTSQAENHPLDAAADRRALIDQTSQLLPRIKITEL